ncbi:uncharacterized protein LOC144360358 [Saccoglossus kowalevskii]
MNRLHLHGILTTCITIICCSLLSFGCKCGPGEFCDSTHGACQQCLLCFDLPDINCNQCGNKTRCQCGPDKFCDSIYGACQECVHCDSLPDVNCNQCNITSKNKTKEVGTVIPYINNEKKSEVQTVVSLSSAPIQTVVVATVLTIGVMTTLILVTVILFKRRNAHKDVEAQNQENDEECGDMMMQESLSAPQSESGKPDAEKQKFDARRDEL